MKISIVVPIYNSEKYLEKCLKSIQNQTHKNFECLMINDGSPDNSKEICKRYADSDSRFLLFSKENEGALNAANYGFERAKGDYLTVMDADDYAESTWLEERVNEIKENNADTVFCGYRAVDTDYRERLVKKPDYKQKVYQGTDKKEIIERIIGYSCEDLYKKLRGKDDSVKREFGAVWRFLYDNKIFQNNKIRFDEEANLAGDVILNSEYLSLCKKVVVSNTYGYNYLYRNDGMVQTYLKSKAIDFCKQKVNAAKSREKVNSKLLQNIGIDFFYAWEASNIFSAIEIGLRLSNDKELPLKRKIRLFKFYLKLNSTQKAFVDLKIRKLKMKYKICFSLIKMHLFTLEYFLISFANRLNIVPNIRG